MNEQKFCQSCGMPMEGAEYGTNTDGSKSEDYCGYCYQKGAFCGEISLEEMIAFCAPMMAKNMPGTTESEAGEAMRGFLPMLKRWKQ